MFYPFKSNQKGPIRSIVLIFIVIVLTYICIFVRAKLQKNQVKEERLKFDKGKTATEPVVPLRPTHKVTLVLPFSAKYPALSMTPMGETIFHPDTPEGDGHPGIDFQWNYIENVTVLASMEGTVEDIRINPLGQTDVVTNNDGWGVDYCGLSFVNPELKIGQKVKVGDYIGNPNVERYDKGKINNAFHWQFGYYNNIERENMTGEPSRKGVEHRLCPMNYFSSDSKALIEKIWAEENWPELKTNAPEICSNAYKYRNE